jgi:hypothetical protein
VATSTRDLESSRAEKIESRNTYDGYQAVSFVLQKWLEVQVLGLLPEAWLRATTLF